MTAPAPRQGGARPRVALVHLGCRVSRADAEALAGRVAQGCDLCPEGAAADVVVVHTCTVTRDADAAARQAIRRAWRDHPGARIVAAGCYAEREPEALASLPGVAAVVGARSEGALAGVVEALARGRALERGSDRAPDRAPAPAPTQGARDEAAAFHHARPLLKVQDGCDEACAYCAVPAARGRSRSLPLGEAVARLLALGRDHAEVVLTGVHLGGYGLDLAPASSLEALVRAALAAGFRGRLRLSSLEPLEVPLGLLADEAVGPHLCDHLHLPIQSGSPAVLRAMGRPYRPSDLRRVVEEVAARRPGLCLGADLMAGFPGETEEDHRATLALCEALPLAYLHVFAYSTRPGTRAAALPGQVPAAVARARAEELRALSARRWAAYLEAQRGRILEPVLERVVDGVAQGSAANRVGLRWPAGPEPRGALARVRVTGHDGRTAAGERVG